MPSDPNENAIPKLVDYDQTREITKIVESCEPHQDVIKIQQYSPSGKSYIQILGKPHVSYSVVCYVTREQKAYLEEAEASGNLLKVAMSHGVYYGYISELRFSALPQNYFSADMALLVGVPKFKTGVKRGQEMALKSITITSNDTYRASSEDVDGYDVITVNVPSSTVEPIKRVTLQSNGPHTVNPSSGFDGIGKVEVTVDIPSATRENKSVKYTTNGTFSVSPNDPDHSLGNVQVTVAVPDSVQLEEKSVRYTTNGHKTVTPSQADGLSSVAIDIDVPKDAQLEQKSVRYTTNGHKTITPSQGKDGLSSVTIDIDVPTEGGSGGNIQPPVHVYGPAYTSIDPVPESVHVRPDPGYDGLEEVVIEPVGLVLEPEHILISNNVSGLVVNPPSGSHGLSSVTIDVEVPQTRLEMFGYNINPNDKGQTLIFHAPHGTAYDEIQIFVPYDL